jgi:hypothetical protein
MRSQVTVRLLAFQHDHDEHPCGQHCKSIKLSLTGKVAFGSAQSIFQESVLAAREESDHLLLYAIEFYFSRDEIKLSRGKDRELAAKGCARTIIQDTDKLVAASMFKRFTAQAKCLAFVKGTGDEVRGIIEKAVEGKERICLTFAK